MNMELVHGLFVLEICQPTARSGVDGNLWWETNGLLMDHGSRHSGGCHQSSTWLVALFLNKFGTQHSTLGFNLSKSNGLLWHQTEASIVEGSKIAIRIGEVPWLN